MPKPSEIDDIFASKGRNATKIPVKALEPVGASSNSKQKNKRKKAKVRDTKSGEPPAGNGGSDNDTKPTSSSKRSAPEEIVDPSLKIASSAAPRKKPKTKGTSTSSAVTETRSYSDAKQASETMAEGDANSRFKDSRGTGPRRRTDEGFLIYKEDELGITDQGGDTPLCPFDCACCY